MIEGIKVNIGGVEYQVPALNFSALKSLSGTIAKLKKIDLESGETELDAVIDIVYHAVRRNYPEITKETLAAGLDLRNTREVLAAIMGQSGLVGEKKAETQAQ